MDENANRKRPKRFLGIGAARLAVGAGAVILAPVVLVLLGLLLAPAATYSLFLHAATQMAGLGPSAFAVEEAGFSRIRLSGLAIGEKAPITAREVAVNFGKLGILSGIKDAAIDGLRVQMRLGEDGTSSGSGPVRLPAMSTPFPLRLSDFKAEILSPAFVFRAQGEGVLILHDGITGRLALALSPQSAAGGVLPHQGTLVFTDGSSAPLMALHLAPQASAATKGAMATVDVVLAAQAAQAPRLTFGLQNVSVPQKGLALGALSLTGTLAASRDSIALSLADCGMASGFAFAGIRLDSARICALDRPFLSLAVAAREALRLAFALNQAQMRMLAANGTPRLSGLLPALAVTAGSDLSAEQVAIGLKAEGGALNGPAALSIRDIALSADARTTDGRLTAIAFTLTRAIVSGIGAMPWLAPITFTGTAKTQASQFRFALDGAGGGVARLVQAEGKADFNGSTGQAHVTLPPLQLGPGTFAPEGLFPGLASRLSQATGRISAEVNYAWDAKGVRSGGTMSLASIGAHLPQGQISGLSGTLALSGLVPLATASPQILRVARLDLGLPLTDGLLRFSIDPRGEARIHEGHLNWLGGTVGVSSGMLSLTGKPQSLTFALDNVDLQELLELAKVKGLSGTGRISGRIPVTIANGRQIVNGGTLSADASGGTLVYKTGQARANPANPSTLLYTALDDFHYETLTGDLSGDLAGLLSLRVHLKGRNPALYDGRQVELNVSTEGAFVDMVRKSLYGYRAP